MFRKENLSCGVIQNTTQMISRLKLMTMENANEAMMASLAIKHTIRVVLRLPCARRNPKVRLTRMMEMVMRMRLLVVI